MAEVWWLGPISKVYNTVMAFASVGYWHLKSVRIPRGVFYSSKDTSSTLRLLDTVKHFNEACFKKSCTCVNDDAGCDDH